MKITFKKRPRNTGLHAVGYPNEGCDIKVDKKVCGNISGPNWQLEGWHIHIAVKKDTSDADPANFKWFTFKKVLASEDEARAYVIEHITDITSRHTLHFFEG